jgi:hypothetical protein
MRKVVDSNQLQSEALRSYLSKSKGNFAVLTDYAAMEAYKGDTLASIYKSMGIVADFPDQVVVLKNTSVVCGLSGRGSGLQGRLVDEGQTRAFGQYARGLYLAKSGNAALRRQLLERGKEATSHLARMLEDAKLTGVVFSDLAKTYSKDEKRSVRTAEPYTAEMVDKIVRSVIRIAGETFKNHPSVNIWPTYKELPNTFIFRVSLCTYLLALDWGASGGAKGALVTTLRNDLVDMNFAAYATFFDGLLSADAKVVRIHQEARLFLSALFDCHMHGGIARKE